MKLAFLLLCICLLLLAQAPVGNITGTVFDESGAVIPAVVVTITNKETGLTRNATTGGEGVFSISSLPAGIYEVKAEVPGFRTVAREATIAVGGLTPADLHLQIGAAEDSIPAVRGR